jgi:hypothetical protein
MTDISTPSDRGTMELTLPPDLRKERYSSKEASKYLLVRHGVNVAVRSLDKWRCTGGGPEFQKFLRNAFYTPAALDAWVAGKLSKPVTSTSALSA